MRRVAWVLSAVGAAATAHAIGACGARTELLIVGDEKTEKSCEQFSALATLASLDVYLLLDSSASMEGETEIGITKWEAVKLAISDFLGDPATVGSRVGLTFFPQIHDDVQVYCFKNEDCGEEEGACMPLGLCMPSETGICQADNQCVNSGDHCQRLGQCQGGIEVFCELAIGSCGGLGDCLPAGFCENRTACDPEEYRIIGLAQLPEQAEGLLAALEQRELEGFTPTLPGISGVALSAKEHSAANPRNKTVVVLATDGLPTSCDPELPELGLPGAIENVVEVATDAHEQGVQTFVIGVFTPDETEYTANNLNTIAAAGGSDEAFIITTDTEVSELFLEALEQVRRSNLCEFALPEGARSLDLTKVRVRVSPEGAPEEWIDFVGDADGCGTAGGFYYDRDPEGEIAPGRIILCPSTCAESPENLLVTCRDQPTPA